jgi:outer membrane lipoprotein-sorting protein
MGKGRLTSDFTPSLVDLPAGMPAGSLALKLLPKSRQQDYDWLVLAVDPTSFVIRGLTSVDAQGGTSAFTFTNMKENVGPADNQFEFTIPRGVDIVQNPSRP